MNVLTYPNLPNPLHALPFAIQLLQKPPNSLFNLIDPFINFVLPTKRILPILARLSRHIRLFRFL